MGPLVVNAVDLIGKNRGETLSAFEADLAVGIIIVASLAMLINRDWRWTIGGLAVQYVGVMMLVSFQWPLGMAMTKLVSGWMAGAVLASTQINLKQNQEEASWPSSRIFRLMAAGLVLIVVWSVAPGVVAWVPGASLQQILGGLILIGIGLLQLGMTSSPFRVIVNLLIILAGFEIIYSVVEYSVLVAGLLVGVSLSLALVGAYLINVTLPEER